MGRHQCQTSLEDQDLPRAQVGRLRKPSGNTRPQSSSLTLSNWKMCRSSCPWGAEWGSIGKTGLGVFPPGATGQRELGASLYGMRGFAHVTDPKLSPKRTRSVTSLLLSFSLSLFLIHFLVWLGLVGFSWLGVVWCGVVWCGVACCGVVARCGAQSRSREKTLKPVQTGFPKENLQIPAGKLRAKSLDFQCFQ